MTFSPEFEQRAATARVAINCGMDAPRNLIRYLAIDLGFGFDHARVAVAVVVNRGQARVVGGRITPWREAA